MPEYILMSVQKGGWLTKSAFTHSDWRQAQVYPEAQAMAMCKLHEGRLIPVELEKMKVVMSGVKP